MSEQLPIKNISVGVDLQHDFVDGTLAVKGGAEVIDPMNRVNDEVRSTDGIVIYTRDRHPKETPHFDAWGKHCIEGTIGAELMPDVEVLPGDYVIDKGQGRTDGYSGMEAYDAAGNTIESLVDEARKEHRVRMFMGGLATDYCVKATNIGAAERYKDDPNVTIYLLLDAVRAVNLEIDDEVRALQAIQDAGVLAISSVEAIEMIRNAC